MKTNYPEIKTDTVIDDPLFGALQARLGETVILTAFTARNVRFIHPTEVPFYGHVNFQEGYLNVICRVLDGTGENTIELHVNGDRQGLTEDVIEPIGKLALTKPPEIRYPKGAEDKIALPGYWLG